MPTRFAFPQVGQLWVPLVPRYHATPRAERTLIPVGRLAADASVQSASAELADIAARLAREHRENDGWTAATRPLRDELMPRQLRIAATAMLGAVSLVLLIACTNVANLLLARATGRQREMAVRLSLGATRGRLLRQLLTESALLGLLSTPLGLAIAYAGLTYMMAAVPPTVIVPYYIEWTVNQRVVLYTVLASLATALVFGLAPAYQAGRASVVAALKDGSRGAGTGRSRNRLRNTLVVAEVALSAVLLVAASLFVRSAVNISRADVGIETAQLMTLRLSMAGDRYATPVGIAAQMNDVVRRIEALPGVASAAVSNLTPFAGGASTGGVVADGAAVEAGREPQAIHFGTTAHGLRTLGQTLIAGRDFTDTEASTLSGTAIVNQALAQRLWPDQRDVIGRRFRFAANPEQPFTVVGLVSDFQPLAVRDKDIVQPVAILPLPHRAARDLGVTIRVAGIAPASITPAARDAIGQSDPSLALFNVRTADEHRHGRIWASQLLSWMFSIFGLVALLLAAIGIYGVLSYSIAQRTQEFGVRMALGATRGNIVTLVVGQAARLAAVGIAIGAAAAFAVTRFVQSILYNVTPGDAIGYAGTALLLIAAVALAGCYPALRATRVDPIEALRAD
jgi:putative ABC transport system permease protein